MCQASLNSRSSAFTHPFGPLWMILAGAARWGQIEFNSFKNILICCCCCWCCCYRYYCAFILLFNLFTFWFIDLFIHSLKYFIHLLPVWRFLFCAFNASPSCCFCCCCAVNILLIARFIHKVKQLVCVGVAASQCVCVFVSQFYFLAVFLLSPLVC